MRLALLVGLLAATWTVGTTGAAASDRPGALKDLRIAKGRGVVAEAWLADPTQRYQHFVLGSDYEAGSLVVKLTNGKTLKLVLGEDAVFEDRQPRLADLDGDGVDEIVLVKSYLTRGAALAVISVRGDKLVTIAETPPTGRPHTWINPAGIADFDGDGRLDIAYVQMPHILGLLRFWTLHDGKLVEIAQIAGVSNHVAGSPHLGLSAVADFDGDGIADLAIPSKDRRTLRVLTIKGGAREIAHRPLSSEAGTDFVLENAAGRPSVVVGLANGRSRKIDF